MYFEINQAVPSNEGLTGTLLSHRSVDPYTQIEFKIDIESAMRLRNPCNELEPPNSFAKLRSPFMNS